MGNYVRTTKNIRVTEKLYKYLKRESRKEKIPMTYLLDIMLTEQINAKKKTKAKK